MPTSIKNPLWSFWGQRALACLSPDDAEFARCLDTINSMEIHDSFDRWYREWINRAEAHFAAARIASANMQYGYAHASYLHASMCYRLSYLPFFGLPADPWLVDAFLRETEAFRCAAELSEFPLEPVEIVVENFSLRAYWGRPNRIARRRGTIIYVNDYGSNLYETFSVHGFAAIYRGYNCLVIDGPGQGYELVRNTSTIRPDWETVIKAVVDFLLHQAEVDPSAITLAGWGWGAALALRAGAFERRIAVLITGPAMSEPAPAAPIALFPGFLGIKNVRLSEVENRLRAPHLHPIMYWKIMKCMVWAHGTRSFKELIHDLGRFEVEPYLSQIKVPTLLSAHVESPLLTVFEKLRKLIQVPTAIMRLPRVEEEESRFSWDLPNQYIFDWLDQTLPVASKLDLPEKHDIDHDDQSTALNRRPH